MKHTPDKSPQTDCSGSVMARMAELYEDDFSYLDPELADEDDLNRSRRKKSPERVAREKMFVRLYEAYMRPAGHLSAFRCQCLLDDMFLLLRDLNTGWANRKAAGYKSAGFGGVDADLALSIGCSYVYDLLKADKAGGRYSDHPVPYCLKVAQNKSIDQYFRKEFGRLPPKKKDDDSDAPENGSEKVCEEAKYNRKEPWQVSLEAMQTDDNGIYRGDRNRILSIDPFAGLQSPRWEADDSMDRLALLYLGELMDYPGEPQKPLALMYGSIIFQLAKKVGGKDDISKIAQKSTRLSSASWAHQRMDTLTLMQLGEKSQQVVRRYYRAKLAWGTAFRQRMEEIADADSGTRRADIVYTETYPVADTANWIESISKSTMTKCAHKLVRDPALSEFAADALGVNHKLCKAIRKVEEKEAGR